MRYTTLAALAVVTMAGSPALAQQQSDVSSYLCTFAGKCGTDAAAGDEIATKAAPATKGFRLATAQAVQQGGEQPTIAAPATKSFRLARQQDTAPQPTTAAPSTKSFRLARTAPAATAPRVAAPVRRYAPRGAAPAVAAVAPRPAPAAGARADLMLTFQLNSDEMTAAAQQKARGFAQALNMAELKDKRFLIEGHTDARGQRDANIDLSRRRAQSVADFLIAQGVDRSRVEVKGVGPDEPLPGHTAASEANRRVEAVLLS
jgi:outer membrane protein OmpA-like peptidoglycan-associated protein